MFIFEKPEKTYAGYIFDCDGTLADSMPLHLRAWNHGLASAGAPLRIDSRAFMSVAGMALTETITHWNATHDLQIDGETAIREKGVYFREHQDEILPIEPVVAFAREVKAFGASVSVASGGTADNVIKTLDFIGLKDFFPVVVTADDVAKSKPAPDLFLLAAEKMGIPPEKCLVLEDSPLGIQAANIAGMDSILLPNLMTGQAD
jgi:HAD superfamily hydrolase (TIGR01509 family)